MISGIVSIVPDDLGRRSTSGEAHSMFPKSFFSPGHNNSLF
jgi:hypothetical protein